jgi:uncharacterized repeat protein (TIGR04076 family)
MTPGTGFLVRAGRLSFPGGGPICVYALQSVMPLLPAKERSFDKRQTADWMWRVDSAQCPDPKGRTIWRIEQRPIGATQIEAAEIPTARVSEGVVNDLSVVVERVDGVCTAGMAPGQRAVLRGGGLYLDQPFCLYALHAVLPLLPAMQRRVETGDWLETERAVICPDPAGNVVLRIDRPRGAK